MTRSKKSNLINNRKVTKNFIKTPKDIIHKNNMKPITRLIYIYLLGLDARKVKVSNNLISSFFKISEQSVARAIKELKDNKLIDIERVGKKDYIYTILEQDQEEQQESRADAEKKNQESQADAEQDQEEQEIIEDLDELTEDEKKVHKFNDLYKQYCISCTEIIKDVKESKIIYIIDKYNEIDIIKTLKEFNKFIEVNEGKYKDNYKYLITNFGRLFKKETNKFNNFTQRNYTKSDFKKLEKSFFNNNDIGADAEDKQKQDQKQESQADAGQEQEHKNNNRKKEDKIYKITEEDKKYTKAYVMQKELVSHLIEIYANIFKIHKPTTQAEYMKALEIECNKYIPKNNKIHDFQERDYTAKEVLEMDITK